MLNEKLFSMLLFSCLVVVTTNALLASCTKIFYKKKPMGHLSHSQLRIKQGNATFEHRLNVFAQSVIFGFVTLRTYLFALLLWIALTGVLYLSTLIGR